MKQPFNYPNYGDWVERAVWEMQEGYKHSILAFSNDVLVGDVVFQPHKTFPRIRELKNVRVSPKLQGRYFGQFMIRQAEREDRSGRDGIIVDCHSDRIDVINLFLFCGYRVLCRAPLYEKGVKEVVMVKSFSRASQGLFIPLRRKFLEGSV